LRTSPVVRFFLEDEAAKKASDVLFCDTDLIVTEIWAEIYKVECPGWVVEEARRRHYDLFLLLAPDVAWERDGLREYPHIRNWHYERLKTELEKRKVPLVIISGDYESRMQQAVEAVDAMLT
jgi:nicotinamide riboside kinase